MQHNTPEESGSVFHISLSWIFLIILVMLGVGVAGGYIGAGLRTPALPLTNGKQELVTQVQEVTISPSIASSQLVRTHEPSVLLLAQDTDNDITPLGVGVVITTDGVIATVQEQTPETVRAFMHDGSQLSLEYLGTDELYGITFYSSDDIIATPFKLAPNDPRVGSHTVSIGRSADTLHAIAAHVHVQTHTTPAASDAPGIQKRIALASTTPLLPGTPLLEDTGDISAIALNEEYALPVSNLIHAMDRLTHDTLERNPFTEIGIAVEYALAHDEDRDVHKIMPRITRVLPNSPASQEDIMAGDYITEVNNTETSWTESLAHMLLEDNAQIVLTLIRNEEEHTITVSRDRESQ